jgi:hypothetical protein
MAGICPLYKIKFKIVHVCMKTEVFGVNINYHRDRCMRSEVDRFNANRCIFLTRIVSLKVPKCFNIFSNPVQACKISIWMIPQSKYEQSWNFVIWSPCSL